MAIPKSVSIMGIPSVSIGFGIGIGGGFSISGSLLLSPITISIGSVVAGVVWSVSTIVSTIVVTKAISISVPRISIGFSVSVRGRLSISRPLLLSPITISIGSVVAGVVWSVSTIVSTIVVTKAISISVP